MKKNNYNYQLQKLKTAILVLNTLRYNEPEEGEKEIVFRRCPTCHWLFQAKEVKRELLGADKVVQKDPLAPAPMEWEYQTNFDKETHVHTFRVYYKCKHCGHEWTALIQKK